MKPLDGKVVLVTGAARGLGRAFAHRLAALGGKVAVLDRSLESYREYAAEARQMTEANTAEEIVARGGEAVAIEVDVTDQAAMDGAVAAVASRWGRIDVGICNAGGGTGPAGAAPAHEVSFDAVRTVMERNYYGTVLTCQPLARVMQAQRSGKIITVSSLAGIYAYDVGGGYADYGSAKAAIAMYTRYLARSLGPFGVTVNCLAPGYTGTARLAENFEKMGQESIRALIPLGRIGTPDDSAGVVEFLAGPLSDYVTGQVIAVDGGVSVFAH